MLLMLADWLASIKLSTTPEALQTIKITSPSPEAQHCLRQCVGHVKCPMTV